MVNSLGECARCNYDKEAPGWTVTTSTDENGTHTAEFTPPTGARHHSQAPPLPGGVRVELSEVEFREGIHLAEPAA